MDAVGIDDIMIYVPKTTLSLTNEFAKKRGVDPEKFSDGLGIEEIRIPDMHEDPITMAAMAVYGLLNKNDIKPCQIGRIDVGTETGVDASKANAAYVLGVIEKIYEETYGSNSLKNCTVIDRKMACAASTSALEDCLNWKRLESLQSRNKYGIVICTDIAKYKLESPGEPTQGSGAVAMLINENPRLIAIDNIFGTYSRDVPDFYRHPTMDTPIVDGKLSEQCYLEAMAGAYEHYCELTGKWKVADEFDYFVFHTPFPKMVEYAVAYLLKHEWRGTSKWEGILKEIGTIPNHDNSKNKWDYETPFLKKFRATEEFKQFFKSKVADSIELTRRIGNMYNGSIYLALVSLLKEQMKKNVELNGKRVAFGSYGSGCTARAFSGTIQSDYKEIVKRISVGEQKYVSFDEYQRLHAELRKKMCLLDWRLPESIVKPTNEFILRSIENGERNYTFVE